MVPLEPRLTRQVTPRFGPGPSARFFCVRKAREETVERFDECGV